VGLDLNHLVFIDETGVSTNLTRRYGRALCGTRLIAKVPHGHWQTTPVVAALRYGGLTAPLALDGPMDGTTFRAYVQQHLASTLHSGDVVIMDNLASHKVAGVREALEAVGARVVYLPPYSPDLNPIEQVFAKFKHLLRSVAKRTRTALWSAMRRLLKKFSAEECRNYFQHCGYTARGK
jgi:transposase